MPLRAGGRASPGCSLRQSWTPATAAAIARPRRRRTSREQLVDNGVDPHVVDELRRLHERGDAYSVYLAPAS